MKGRAFLFTGLVLLLLFIFLTQKSSAHRYGNHYVILTTTETINQGAIQHWNHNQMPVVYEVNPTGAPEGTSAAAQKAFQTWQDVEPAYITFAGIETTDNNYDLDDKLCRGGVPDDRNLIKK